MTFYGFITLVFCNLHCIYIYIYIPPPPPLHSASYNIAATTTCASSVSVPVGHRKRPPVQVTVATTTCASRVSLLVGHRKRPPPVQVTVTTTTCASRVSALVGHRKRPPVQVTNRQRSMASLRSLMLAVRQLDFCLCKWRCLCHSLQSFKLSLMAFRRL